MINLFFDFDMTLGYRITMWTATVRELLLENCVVADEKAIRPFTSDNGYPWNRPDLSHAEFLRGKGWWENTCEFIFKNLVKSTLCDKIVAKKVADAFPAKYSDLAYWRLFPDTISTLEKLKSRDDVSINILSNHVPEARKIIEGLGIEKYFDNMIISAEVGYEKPSPFIYEKARALYNTDDLFIMIGDNYKCDVIGSRENGFYPIFARETNEYGFSPYCKDFSNLEKTIEDIKNETR